MVFRFNHFTYGYDVLWINVKLFKVQNGRVYAIDDRWQ